MNKKAQFATFWIEYVAAGLLLVVFYIAARSSYVGVSYLTALLIGIILGKFWHFVYKNKKSKVMPTIFSMAVLLGLIMGSFGADRRFIVILYGIGMGLSYVAHKERWIKTI